MKVTPVTDAEPPVTDTCADPLIDRDKIMDAIHAAHVAVGVNDPNGYCLTAMDNVFDYLRDVLTPEALKTYETFVASDGHLSSGVLSGGDLHRRIFGEDR